jgi:hypothetical protein
MRLRFSIRDLLWLTLVVVLALGWCIDRNRVVSQRDEWESRATLTMDRLDTIRTIRYQLQERMLKLAKKQNNQEIEDEIKRLNEEAADN